MSRGVESRFVGLLVWCYPAVLYCGQFSSSMSGSRTNELTDGVVISWLESPEQTSTVVCYLYIRYRLRLRLVKVRYDETWVSPYPHFIFCQLVSTRQLIGISWVNEFVVCCRITEIANAVKFSSVEEVFEAIRQHEISKLPMWSTAIQRLSEISIMPGYVSYVCFGHVMFEYFVILTSISCL